MKNPNGYGTVAKLSGNRRNPYVVRKTIGWNEKGHPIYNTIGYYPTREAGMIALGVYNQSPYDVDAQKITMEELYAKWLENRADKLGASNLRGLKAAYKHCKNTHKMKYKDLRAFHMQDVIDKCGKSHSTQGNIKSLYNHLDKYAFELDIISKRFSELTVTSPAPETSRRPFTDEEVNALWAIKDEPWVDTVLIFLYSGWRISELLGLKTDDVNIEEGTMKGGVKTQSGKNRLVPIHSKILDMVKARHNGENKYLISHDGKKLTASKYYTFWYEIMARLNMSHTPHECRHTFRTRLDSAGANRVCADRIMGHSSGSTGERVYTHKTVQDLKDTIELITG